MHVVPHGVTRTERAHAKINVLLRILAREASGYHGIETLFQRLALHDVVQVAVNEAPRALTCDGPGMPAGGIGAPEHNLAWRAAALYCEAARWHTGWQITIRKHIPVGGGLGGGSADAAAVLRALEALCPTPLGLARLLELAGQRVRILGYQVKQSRPTPWTLMLAPMPLVSNEVEFGLAEDLPPTVVRSASIGMRASRASCSTNCCASPDALHRPSISSPGASSSSRMPACVSGSARPLSASPR